MHNNQCLPQFNRTPPPVLLPLVAQITKRALRRGRRPGPNISAQSLVAMDKQCDTEEKPMDQLNNTVGAVDRALDDSSCPFDHFAIVIFSVTYDYLLFGPGNKPKIYIDKLHYASHNLEEDLTSQRWEEECKDMQDIDASSGNKENLPDLSPSM